MTMRRLFIFLAASAALGCSQSAPTAAAPFDVQPVAVRPAPIPAPATSSSPTPAAAAKPAAVLQPIKRLTVAEQVAQLEAATLDRCRKADQGRNSTSLARERGLLDAEELYVIDSYSKGLPTKSFGQMKIDLLHHDVKNRTFRILDAHSALVGKEIYLRRLLEFANDLGAEQVITGLGANNAQTIIDFKIAFAKDSLGLTRFVQEAARDYAQHDRSVDKVSEQSRNLMREYSSLFPFPD
jgi:hypothetical protein